MREKRTAKLQRILANLKGGKIVQNRQLKVVLGDKGYARSLDDYKAQQDLRQTYSEKPSEIIEYERRLKKAMFAYNKGDVASARGHSEVGQKLMHNADHLFEQVLEYLSEMVGRDPSLRMWFDRDLGSENVTGTRLSPQNIPQVVTSRSSRNRGGGYQFTQLSIRQVKIAAVERELELMQQGGEEEVSQADFAAVLQRANRLRRLASD